jgi:magnesium transporter
MLVNCAAYQDGKRLADIHKEQISEYVHKPNTFVWVALYEPSDAELDEMAVQFELHPLAVEDARHGHQRPKVEEWGDQLFAVLHVVEMKGAAMNTGEVNIFVGPNFVFSIRRGTEVGFQAVRERAEREPELLKNGSGFVFYCLIDNIVDRYFPVVDFLEGALEKIEERIFKDGTSPRANIESLYVLKGHGMTLRHAVEPLIEAIHKLYGGRVPQVCVGTQAYFRDVYDHLLRVSQQLDGLRDMVVTAMSVNLAMITLEDNKVTKRLASYAALIAVPTLIAGIYGMNFKNMPELEWTYGYPLALSLMAVFDVWIYRKLTKAGWL